MDRRFVPSISSDLNGLDELTELFCTGTVAVLTGAGCSTASGIPDYRGPETRNKKRSPITYQQFVRNKAARRRYWARSAIGWPRVRDALPNDAHRALATLEDRGYLSGVITQNVDGLHRQAGSRHIVDLHGDLSHVICLDCRTSSMRDVVQRRIEELNPGWTSQRGQLAPDGDVDIPDEIPPNFHPPPCTRCGGLLKPDVVFFGENVRKSVVKQAWDIIESADALLVVGSSLTVYSGFRFVRGADERDLPVAIINLGETRGAPHARIHLQARAGEALTALLDRLCT